MCVIGGPREEPKGRPGWAEDLKTALEITLGSPRCSAQQTLIGGCLRWPTIGALTSFLNRIFALGPVSRKRENDGSEYHFEGFLKALSRPQGPESEFADSNGERINVLFSQNELQSKMTGEHLARVISRPLGTVMGVLPNPLASGPLGQPLSSHGQGPE